MNFFTGGLIAAELRRALLQPGCPICRIRDEAERRYLRSLLWEHVSDPATRAHIRASMGYCSAHTWQMGWMEVHGFGSALGNSTIYADLVGIVHGRLSRYLRGMLDGRPPTRLQQWARWAGGHWTRRDAVLGSRKGCRVCQIGAQAESSHVYWLLQGLSQPDLPFSAWYGNPGMLCLHHLSRALEWGKADAQAGTVYLVAQAVEYLEHLEADLLGFGGKHAWDRRHERMTPAEKESWRNALAFFGGSERSEGERTQV